MEGEIFDIYDEDNYLYEIIDLMDQIYRIVHIDNGHDGDIDHGSQKNIYNNLLQVYEKEYLPISVFRIFLQLSARHLFFI